MELTGTDPVEVTGDNADDFSVISQPSAQVEGGQSTTFTVEFTPSAAGLRVAAVRILNNDSDEGEFTFAIQGYGLEPPEIAVTGNDINIVDCDSIPSTLDGTDFGDAEVGGEAVQTTFTIENTGDTQLNLTGSVLIEITGSNAGEFAIVEQPNAIINGGQSTTFTISFTPSGLGHREATVHIPNNDADEGGFNFAIQGNGIESSGNDYYYNYIPLFIKIGG